MKTIVVGAGVAGTAAALTAAWAGARVTLVDGGTGASTLATGAIDAIPWQKVSASAHPVTGPTRAVLDALAAYSLPEGGARLVTMAGLVRSARGSDLALLDVGSLGGKRIGVVRCDRPGWDARALACAWGNSFAVLDATGIRHADERALPDADFAARHDDDARVAWLGERLRAALGSGSEQLSALVLPPSLGVVRPRAQSLSRLVGVPCGEAMGLPGGPSGLRFEQARDRALDAANVDRVRGRVTSVIRMTEHPRGAWRIAIDGEILEADSLVLSTGGLIGGGIEYAPSDAIVASALPPFSRPSFHLTIDAPLVIGARGRALDLPGSLFGVPPESLAWPSAHHALIDSVGAVCDAQGRVEPGLFAAGELRADRPRTWLDAICTGATAGAAATQDASISGASRGPSTGATPPSRP